MKPRTFRVVHHVAGALVVAAWGLAMTRMAASEWQRRATQPDLAVSDLLGERDAADVRAFGVYHGEAKIGFASSRRMRGAGGWVFVDQAVWKMVLQGVPQRLVSESQAVVDDSFALRSFRARIDSGLMKISAEGRVEGDTLLVSLTSAGKTFEDRQPLSGPVMLPAMIRPAVAARNPAQGDSWVFGIFNPLARGVEEVEVVVEGRETLQTAIGPVETWRLSEILRGSIRTQVWIDAAGETVRELSPVGFEIRVEPREMALAVDEAGGAPVPDLVFAVSVPVSGDLVRPVAAGTVRVRLSGIDLPEFPLLSGGRQRLEGDVLTVQEKPHRASYALPYLGGDLADALRAEPLVQSDDPDVVAEARRITGAAPGAPPVDAATAAKRLHDWVFANVRKRNSAGVPSAVEVLKERTGDCNEHTVLYVALARAIGLPARVAVGLVWTNARGGGPGLYYHAWPEVFLGVSGDATFGGAEGSDGWFALDPTIGQFPADAGHFRFLVGGLERQIDLLKLMGRLEVAVVPDPANPRSAP